MKRTLFFLLILVPVISFSQKTIKGTVFDSNDGSPIPGAVVKVKGTTIATITDFEGKYILNNVPNDSNTLEFSIFGMETQEIAIEGEIVNCYMNRSEVILEEVVITALGVTKERKAIGYSITSVTSESYTKPKKGKKDAAYYGGDDGTGYHAQIGSGQLTAGELNDFGKWEMWQDIAKDQLNQYVSVWNIYPKTRYCVLLTDQDNKPVINANVFLKTKSETIWTAKTDNTGKAELWANIFDTINLKKLFIQVEFQGKINSIENPSTFHEGINLLSIDTKCDIPDIVDIAFVFDATGSMSDEMSYLQAEILDVINRIEKDHKDLTVKLGSVFYRDKGDAYVTIFEDFTSKITSAVNYIKKQRADGGGDFPEAVDEAIDVAVNQLNWDEDARARIIFLVLDAPPHQTKEAIRKIQKATKEAAAKGIRIIPITCSGIDKSTEYLMRSMALATNGTYVFLTDDSGIGNSHIEPTTDEWDVEFLNDLIVRLVDQYIVTPTCDNQITVDKEDLQEDTVLVNYNIIEKDSISNDIDTIFTTNYNSTNVINPDVTEPSEQKLKIYPNPTEGDLTIEITGEISEFYICDFSGKILERHETGKQSEIKLNIGIYPQGIYFVRYFVGDELKSGKVILMY
ncbi:MAG: carboxypeptidase-like regulatory domain-containing protein [Bacteroidales bacterium]|nr:carboxypeptidase-like regulatory domain-containing protein [Bacteroidales bacterium]